MFYSSIGKKIIDIKTRRDASRGRKSKAGGKKIKSDSIIYTPEKKTAGWRDRWTDGQTETDGWTDRQTNRLND